MVFDIPTGIDVAIEKQTHITVTGVDRQLVGQVAANIRRLRKPDPVQAEGRPLHRRSAEEEGREDRGEVDQALELQDQATDGDCTRLVTMKIKTKDDRRVRIQLRQRKRIAGTTERPRLSVFRSVTHIYAQVIDDLSGETLVSASSVEPALKGAFAKDVARRQHQGRRGDRQGDRRAVDRKGHQARGVRPQRLPVSRAHSRRGGRGAKAGLEF